MKLKGFILANLYNAFALGVMAYLAVVFEKWWIILFSVFFIQSYEETQTYKGANKDEGGDE